MDNATHGEDNNTPVPYLICHSCACLFGIPLASVAETMRPLAATPLAAGPAFVLGISVIRGAPVPVVDAAGILGTTPSAPPQRLVMLKLGERRVGLAVERVLGVHSLPIQALAEVPPLMHNAGAEAVAAISLLDSQLLLVLQAARLVPETVWAAIAPHTSPS